jgi:hypothetical protein
VDVDPLSVFHWSHDGLSHLLGEPHYRTRKEAERAWQVWRSAVWANAHRFHIPGPAKVYDGLTNTGWEELWRTWSQVGGPNPEAVRAALDHDRAAIRAFERRDRKGAQAIAFFLELLLVDLDHVQREANRIAEYVRTSGKWWDGGAPAITSGTRYGAGVS